MIFKKQPATRYERLAGWKSTQNLLKTGKSGQNWRFNFDCSIPADAGQVDYGRPIEIGGTCQ